MDLYVASWSEYDIGNMYTATRGDLQKAVRRAAKTANQRLRRLEKAGATKGLYKNTISRLSGRRRFIERTENRTLNELRREYAMLRHFISAKTSTLQGKRKTDRKRYETAVSRGYEGTLDEFNTLVETVFSEYNERFFSSEITYQAVITGTTDLINEAISRVKQQDIPERLVRGKSLVEYLTGRNKRMK